MPSGVYKRSEETKNKLRELRKGKYCSYETKQKMSLVRKGRKLPPFSLEHKKKISLARKGKSSNNRGGYKLKDFTEEHRKKLSESKKGEKNHWWKGGISFESYTTDWTKTLKRSIRERDKYTCQICNKEPSIFVHHKDYNKKNCNSNNLITLCVSCHGKTNSNRNYWMNYFRI